MTDASQVKIRRLTANMAIHAATVTDHIASRPPGAPFDQPSRPHNRRGTRTIPRPAECPLVAWENAQRRDAMRLTRLLTGHDRLTVLGAAEIAQRLDHPVVGYNLDQLTDRLTGADGQGGNPLTRAWRRTLFDLAGAWHEAASSIHDGWWQLWHGRWTVTPRGDQILDEMAEANAISWIGTIERTARQLSGLCHDLTGTVRICATVECRRPAAPHRTVCERCRPPRPST